MAAVAAPLPRAGCSFTPLEYTGVR
jgi:hypothetical protein